MGRIQSLAAATAVAAGTLLGTPAVAAPCAPASNYDQLPFFAMIEPSDSPLDVWCRLHDVLKPGDYKVKVVFSAAKRKMFEGDYRAERIFDVKMPAAEANPRMQLASLLQSLIPTRSDQKARSPDGQPFPLALEWVVQGTAASTPAVPESQGLGLPASYPGAKTFAFWMPIALKMTPINLFGEDFHVQVVFRPHVGRLIMAIRGEAERLVLKASSEKAFPFGKTEGCPADRAPDCKDMADTIDLLTAWTVESVTLTSARTGRLTAATRALVPWLLQGGVKPSVNTMEQGFVDTEGGAKLKLQSKTREVDLLASPDPEKASGTKSITIVWRERQKMKGTYATWLDERAQAMRSEILLKYGSGARKDTAKR